MKSLTLAVLPLLLLSCHTGRNLHDHMIPNFDRVDQNLYRSGQFGAMGLDWLKLYGIQSVLCLRDGDVWPAEESLCRQAGITWTNVPMHPLLPSDQSLHQAMTVLKSLPKPVLVHCQFGSDRTGLVVGCHRISTGWTPENAYREALEFGASPMFGLKSALQRFALRKGKP